MKKIQNEYTLSVLIITFLLVFLVGILYVFRNPIGDAIEFMPAVLFFNDELKILQSIPRYPYIVREKQPYGNIGGDGPSALEKRFYTTKKDTEIYAHYDTVLTNLGWRFEYTDDQSIASSGNSAKIYSKQLGDQMFRLYVDVSSPGGYTNEKEKKYTMVVLVIEKERK